MSESERTERPTPKTRSHRVQTASSGDRSGGRADRGAAAEVLLLQRRAGNQGVVKALRTSHGVGSPAVQRIFGLGEPKAPAPEISAPQGARPMTVEEQQLSPSASDLNFVKRVLKAAFKDGVILTPAQAWALFAVSRKAHAQEAENLAMAIAQLPKYNAAWGTDYGVGDLPNVVAAIQSRKLATNYFLNAPPGANTKTTEEIKGKTPLYELLLKSPRFLQFWETNVSQASVDSGTRGFVEEQMGYTSPLKRTGGAVGDKTGTFSPTVEGRAEMPKYAAPISENQKTGVGKRYGSSYIVWKDNVKLRTTLTPKDSWNPGHGIDKIGNFNHPYALIAYGPDHMLLRMIFAEATGKDKDWFKTFVDKTMGDTFSEYFEAQIHGDLTWNDVAEVHIGWGKFSNASGTYENTTKERAEEIKKAFDEHKAEGEYDYKVVVAEETVGLEPDPTPL